MTFSTEEKYLVATNTSNLRVEAERTGAADVLIAAGWSASRIGGALMRLHTKATRDNMALVHEQVSMKADSLGIERPDAVASAVIAWWMDRVCPVCHGRKYDTIKDTPSLSTIECPKCHGSGERKFPSIDGAAQMEAWISKCKHEHVRIIKSRLRNNQQE